MLTPAPNSSCRRRNDQRRPAEAAAGSTTLPQPGRVTISTRTEREAEEIKNGSENARASSILENNYSLDFCQEISLKLLIINRTPAFNSEQNGGKSKNTV